MNKKKYVYFKDNEMWLGYWEEFPDYMTQGSSLNELKENLIDIYIKIFQVIRFLVFAVLRSLA